MGKIYCNECTFSEFIDSGWGESYWCINPEYLKRETTGEIIPTKCLDINRDFNCRGFIERKKNDFTNTLLDYMKILLILLFILTLGSKVFSQETSTEPPIVDGELLAYDLVTPQGDYLYHNNFQADFPDYSQGQGLINNKFVTYTSRPKCGNIYEIEVTYQEGTKQVIKGYKNSEEIN